MIGTLSKSASKIAINMSKYTPTQETISTRFLLISDTHDNAPAEFNNMTDAFRQPFGREPLGSADVILHAGDLTMIGGASNYKRVIQWLGDADAEIKIVIAGNHDIDLDAEYYRMNSGEQEDVAEQDIEDAKAVWGSREARERGIVYLEEGCRTFRLSSGAEFTIYTSPYQSEFCGWAFPYTRDVDRYNPPTDSSSLTARHPAPKNPIPSFPNVDILLTHGPPHGILDATHQGEHVGCEHLARAVERARPRLHVFGHIHEGWGAERRTWAHPRTVERVETDRKRNWAERGARLDLRGMVFGEETAFVNAAILDVNYRTINAPWVVDLELPKAD